MTVTDLPVLVVAITLLAAFAAPVVSRGRRGLMLAFVTAVASALGSLLVARTVLATGTIRYPVGGWPPPWGIELVVDGRAAFMLCGVSMVMAVVLWFAQGHLQREAEHGGRWFPALSLLLLASMLGIVMTGDLFNMFVFVEIASVAACGMVAIKGNGPALEASFRYLVLSALGTGMLLFGIALVYIATGHLNFQYIAAALPEALALFPGNIYAALGLIFLGFAVKAALFPVHVWLPDAHSVATTPASAILSGLVVKAFAFGWWRTMVLGFAPALVVVPVGTVAVVLGGVAMIAGSLLAAGQTNLKRLLAYSTVAQMGFVFVGLGLGGERAVTGALIYAVVHGAMKAGMFIYAGTVTMVTGGRSTGDLAGMGSAMPLMTAAFSVIALSLIGLPPLAGFTGKLYLVMGALDQGQPGAAVLIVIGSLLTALYILPLLSRMYFGPTRDRVAVPAGISAAVVAFAGAVVALGILPSIMLMLLGR